MSSLLEMERLRNTYYYTLTSADGENFDDIGNFDFQIPTLPQQEHNSAARCIFTLQGFVIGDQVAGQAVGITAYLSLEVNGIGLSGNNYNSTNAIAGGNITLRQSNRFLIPNIYEEFDSITATTNTTQANSTSTNSADAVVITTVNGATTNGVGTTTPVQRLTGAWDLTNPYELLCSNPVGKNIHLKVFLDDGTACPANVNLNTIIRFKIEIIPN